MNRLERRARKQRAIAHAYHIARRVWCYSEGFARKWARQMADNRRPCSCWSCRPDDFTRPIQERRDPSAYME